MKEEVRKYIEKHHLLVPQRKVLVALSGGPDSIALLLLLQELHYSIIALHCNFHLRDEESDEDQLFVEQLCQRNDIPLKIAHFETRKYAKENHISIEMAARNLRYEWFSKILQETDAQAIAVGHHQDDQAETLLLNLVRGTGLRGLAGMHPKQGNVVRPLLCIGRQDILDYLQRKRQDYRIDHTNLEREAQRNCIRLDIIPLLKSLNPKAIENMAKTADIVFQSLPFYYQGIKEEETRKGIKENFFPKEILDDKNLSCTLLHEWLKDKGFNASQEKDILSCNKKESGKIWESSKYQILLNRGDLLLREKIDNDDKEPILQYTEVTEMGEHSPNIIYVDKDRVKIPFQLKKAQVGDRFYPFGMKGTRLLSDFFTDLKMSYFEKKKQWIAYSEDKIVWIIGKRADNRFRVTDKTERILKIEIVNP